MKLSLFNIFLSTALVLVLLPAAVWADCDSIKSQFDGGNPLVCCASHDMSGGGNCLAQATEYRYTVDGVGFEKSDGTVTWVGSSETFDMAQVGIGQVLGNMISQANLTPGTYPAMIVKLNKTINLSTSGVTEGSSNHYACNLTGTGQWSDVGSLSACSAPGYPTPLNPDACLNGNDVVQRFTQQGNIVVDGKTPVTITFTIYTEEAAVCTYPAGGAATAIAPGNLVVHMSLQ